MWSSQKNSGNLVDIQVLSGVNQRTDTNHRHGVKHTHLTHFFLELLQIHLDLICQLVESQEALAVVKEGIRHTGREQRWNENTKEEEIIRMRERNTILEGNKFTSLK